MALHALIIISLCLFERKAGDKCSFLLYNGWNLLAPLHMPLQTWLGPALLALLMWHVLRWDRSGVWCRTSPS